MSRNRRRWEEPASSHWEPEYHRYSSDEYSRRHYAPPTEFLPRSSFNYWRDDVAVSASYYPRRSYGRESYNERWRDDRRTTRHAESSYSRQHRADFGPGRERDDRGSWRDRPPQQAPRRHYSTNTSPLYTHRLRAESPVESVPPLPRPAPESPRKASPRPHMPSQPPKPSPTYLSLSKEPSENLSDPAMSRKLLVLDLNGTLLIRSARSRTTSGPQLRPVQPRPYMQSFRQYLFCLETKAWLDTMVWSSAQPHSVDDMVDKVFGAFKGELRAVWNRKSLGLSEVDYHRKSITTKDLTKPWDLFASALTPEKIQGHHVVSPGFQIIHSASTTLLLDDSPHKAALQPYNHVCIPEYDSKRRQHDLKSFLATKELKPNKKTKQKVLVETAARSIDEMVPELFPKGALTGLADTEHYDVILLAVIGILDTLKFQSNVAGWIRKGGLWATRERGVEEGALDVNRLNVVETDSGKNISSTTVRTGEDANSTSDAEVQLQTGMWFNDSSVVAFWVARGRKVLTELGIQAIHGVTG